MAKREKTKSRPKSTKKKFRKIAKGQGKSKKKPPASFAADYSETQDEIEREQQEWQKKLEQERLEEEKKRESAIIKIQKNIRRNMALKYRDKLELNKLIQSYRDDKKYRSVAEEFAISKQLGKKFDKQDKKDMESKRYDTVVKRFMKKLKENNPEVDPLSYVMSKKELEDAYADQVEREQIEYRNKHIDITKLYRPIISNINSLENIYPLVATKVLKKKRGQGLIIEFSNAENILSGINGLHITFINMDLKETHISFNIPKLWTVELGEYDDWHRFSISENNMRLNYDNKTSTYDVGTKHILPPHDRGKQIHYSANALAQELIKTYVISPLARKIYTPNTLTKFIQTMRDIIKSIKDKAIRITEFKDSINEASQRTPKFFEQKLTASGKKSRKGKKGKKGKKSRKSRKQKLGKSKKSRKSRK